MAGDQDDGLDRLYRDYRQNLLSYVRDKFGAGPPDPEEVVHEAFIRLARQRETGMVEDPRGYLKVAARNVAIDAFRSSVRTIGAMKTVSILQENTRDPDAMDVLSSRDELQRLAKVIDKLKPKERVAFLLHRIDGLTFVEIGRRMGMSPSNARLLVKSALATCIARMKS